MAKIENRLKELGIALPRPPKAVANYIPAVKVGEILYVAGTIGTVVGPNDTDNRAGVSVGPLHRD
jgi:enamine deaminase RidA (YjgF/YER057c/UK114 family)